MEVHPNMKNILKRILFAAGVTFAVFIIAYTVFTFFRV